MDNQTLDNLVAENNKKLARQKLIARLTVC